MSFMHDPTLQVTDAAIATWQKLCPDLDLASELKEQPWQLLHDRPEDKTLGSYWLLPCGLVAVIRKTVWYAPTGRQVCSRLRLITFLTPKRCKTALALPEAKKITLTDEQWRQRKRLHEKLRRKRRQAEKRASVTNASAAT